GAELVDLVTHRLCGRRRRRRARIRAASAPRLRKVVLTVRDPDVAVAIDVDAVRKHEHPGAEALDELARRIELEHDVDFRELARGTIEAAVGAAPLCDPDGLAVLVDINGAGRSPRASLRHLEVVLDGFVR